MAGWSQVSCVRCAAVLWDGKLTEIEVIAPVLSVANPRTHDVRMRDGLVIRHAREGANVRWDRAELILKLAVSDHHCIDGLGSDRSRFVTLRSESAPPNPVACVFPYLYTPTVGPAAGRWLWVALADRKGSYMAQKSLDTGGVWPG